MSRSWERVESGDKNQRRHPQPKDIVYELRLWGTGNKMHFFYSSAKSCASGTKPACKSQLDNRHCHDAKLARTSRISGGDK